MSESTSAFLANKPLVPTRKSEAPLLAAHLPRWAAQSELVDSFGEKVMRIKKIVALGLVGIGLTGCITYGNLEKHETLDKNSNEAVIVLGVQPRYRVAIGRGSIVDGQIKIGNGGFATLNVFPEGGYIVGKVPAASSPDEYHIALILPEGIGGFVPMYSPCGAEKAVSFVAPAGRVVYVGDINFSPTAGQLKIDYSMNFDAAQRFLTQQYPQLAARLERQSPQAFPFAGSTCTPKHITIPITVYIGNGK